MQGTLGASALLCTLLVTGAASAGDITVSFSDGTSITASNVGSAVGQSNGSFSSGNGTVAIASGLDSSISGTTFSAVDDAATGEVGLRWGVEADHCLGAGGCGGVDHFADATADLTLVIEVQPGIASWEFEVGVQSYGNLNGLVDGGTLPACTSIMSGAALAVSTVGAVTAVLSGGTGLATVSDSGDCTQDVDWFKNEEALLTISGTGSGSFEVHLEQDASVESEVQTNIFAIKNGSDTCFRAGMDPGDGIAFFDACDYPGLADIDGDRDNDGVLGDEPNDGGIWVTDRLNGSAIRLSALTFEPLAVPVMGWLPRALLGMLLVGAGVRLTTSWRFP